MSAIRAAIGLGRLPFSRVVDAGARVSWSASEWQPLLQPGSLLRASLPALPRFLSNLPTTHESKSPIVAARSIFLSNLPIRASKSLIAVSRVTTVAQQKSIYFEISKIGSRNSGADREGVDPPAVA